MESSLHAALVQALIANFKNMGVTVTHAAAPGFDEPDAYGRHEPDVVGFDRTGALVLGEAKCGDSDMQTKHSKEQFEDFAAEAEGGFYLGVPHEYWNDHAMDFFFDDLPEKCELIPL